MNTLTLSIINLDQLQHTVTARHQFDYTGGTIGSEGASWVIDDRDHTVAPIHCEIRWVEEGYCVIDRCHRTYLNNSIESLGALPPRRLLEGDRLRIGAYWLQVLLSHEHADMRSLEGLFDPDHKVLDRLIADVPARAWQPSLSEALPVAEICSIFEPCMGSDPLAALDAGADAGPLQANTLERLLAGKPL